jgi:enamine deaminase RidA (YjgF/YER057c/UK114 family)
MDVRRITTPAVAELATATWTNALRIGEEIVMSGMTAHPATRDAGEPMGAYAQTLEVLRKLLAYVEAAGGNKRNLYKLVIYVTDIADKDEVGRARREFFAAPYPCSTLVEVKGLVFPELKVEIDAWARLDVDLSRCGP